MMNRLGSFLIWAMIPPLALMIVSATGFADADRSIPVVPFFNCDNFAGVFGKCSFLGSFMIPNGQVGIGTENPIAPLHVEDDVNGDILIMANNLAPEGDSEGLVAAVHSQNGEAIEAINANPHPLANVIVACNDQSSSGDCSRGSIVFRVKRNGEVTADGAFIGGGADYADLMQVSGDISNYEPGDVLVLPQAGEGLELSNTPYSRLVIGVYSTNPAFLGDADNVLTEGIEQPEISTSVPVALVGIVPVKVSAENGVIQPGDLLVTSTTLGHAMKATPVVIEGFEIFPQGTILGKAMESHTDGLGMINVLVNLK